MRAKIDMLCERLTERDVLIADLRAQLAAANQRIEEAEKCEPYGYFCKWVNGNSELYIGEPGSATFDDWNELPEIQNMPLYTRPVPPADVAELQRKFDESVTAQNELHEQIYGNQQRIAELENRLADETAQLDLMNVEYRKSELHCAKLAQVREKAVSEHCMCAACRDGTIHSSDCSVHNMPAYPNGSCYCGVLSQAREKAVPDERLRIAFASVWAAIPSEVYFSKEDIARVEAMLCAAPLPANLNAKEGGE